MSIQILRAPQLAEKLSISKSTLWRWCKNKAHFPQPKKISEGVTVWFADEVQDWLDNQRNKEVLEVKK